MRVLTVRQPWAWAIIHRGKDVENRVQNIAGTYRGPVAIHAGLAFDRSGFDDATLGPIIDQVIDDEKDLPGDHECRSTLTAGVILGVVDLVGVHAGWIEPQGKPCSPWGINYVEHAGQHHLVLANPRPIDPIPAKGRLGLWRPDPTLRVQIAIALDRANPTAHHTGGPQ